MIEVHIHQRGRVRGNQVDLDPAIVATCTVCGTQTDAVAALGDSFACKSCLRERLEAMTLGAYMIASPGGLPWGQVTS